MRALSHPSFLSTLASFFLSQKETRSERRLFHALTGVLALVPVILFFVLFLKNPLALKFHLFLYALTLGIGSCAALCVGWLLRVVGRTAQRELLFLDSIADGVCVVSHAGDVLLLNPAGKMLCGIKEKERHPFSFASLGVFSCGIKKRLISLPEDLLACRSIRNWTLQRHDGHITPLLISIAPLPSSHEGEEDVIIVFRDATEEKKIEQAKDDFVSLASHQLRTPLATLQWYLEVLLAGDAGALTKKQRSYVTILSQTARRMNTLVASLLNLSRMELDTFLVEKSRVHLPTLIKEKCSELKTSIKEKKLRVRVAFKQGRNWILTDPRLLGIVFQNIFSNACKYTPPQGAISVSGSCTSHLCIITVRDTGRGIPAEEQHSLFTKFFRAGNIRQDDVNGSGLGLFMTKKIIERLGGEIAIESREGKGTTVKLSLPL